MTVAVNTNNAENLLDLEHTVQTTFSEAVNCRRDLEHSKAIFHKIFQLTTMYYQFMFGFKRISSSKDMTETVML